MNFFFLLLILITWDTIKIGISVRMWTVEMNFHESRSKLARNNWSINWVNVYRTANHHIAWMTIHWLGLCFCKWRNFNLVGINYHTQFNRRNWYFCGVFWCNFVAHHWFYGSIRQNNAILSVTCFRMRVSYLECVSWYQFHWLVQMPQEWSICYDFFFFWNFNWSIITHSK